MQGMKKGQAKERIVSPADDSGAEKSPRKVEENSVSDEEGSNDEDGKNSSSVVVPAQVHLQWRLM
jgi:hypothetical protein